MRGLEFRSSRPPSPSAFASTRCPLFPSFFDTLSKKTCRPSDAYHTCYVLAGLSSAQHEWRYEEEAEDDKGRQAGSCSSSRWVASPSVKGQQIFDERDRISTIHPVYTIPQRQVDAILRYFTNKPGF